MAEDRSKLLVNNHGIVVGLAGKESAVTSDGNEISLLRELPGVVSQATTPAAAAAAIVDLFDARAGLWGAHAGLPATAARPFTVPVLTVALIGGMAVSGPSLFAVGMAATGPPEMHSLRATTLFAPQPVEVDLAALALADDGVGPVPVLTSVAQWGRRLLDAQPFAPALLTADFDHAAATSPGATQVNYHRRPDSNLPRH